MGLGLLTAAAWLVAGLALSRLLYEWRFPEWAALARPGPVALLALAVVLAGLVAYRRFGRLVMWSSLPLMVNLLWLLDPAVDLPRGRFLFAAGWWLVAATWAWLRLGDNDRRWPRLGPLLIAGALLPVYLLTMSSAVGAADTFEFQVVAPQLGIAHPTGYPLYLLLGKLFSLLPPGTVAWRLNLASAVYGVAAATLVFRLALDLLGRPLAALAGAVVLGLVPIYWSQAIVAEVYTLHALVVAAALWLMARLLGDRSGWPLPAPARRKAIVALMFVIGLGLTNHLTTVFLLPPAAVTIALVLAQRGRERSAAIRPVMRFLPPALAFLAPLLIYAYLPLRWRAIHSEPMGAARFAEWVLGGRFQGALQPLAWLRDPARWAIVGRLLLDAWGWLTLALALVGLVYLFWRNWRVALVLLIATAGFTFYTLNYYVPDLAVFLIPTHVVIAVWVAAGSAALLEVGALWERGRKRNTEGQGEGTELHGEAISSSVKLRIRASWPSVLLLAVMLPTLAAAGSRWSAVDQSADDGGEPWARGVLGLPLARGAAVLADSEKIAPLYYLQQIEGLRRDLDIMVLPDEAAYRAELDARLAAGGAVYLARYLPGLAGVYHLRSAGPLVEVSREPLAEVPAGATATDLVAGPLRLLGYAVEPVAAVDENAAGFTLYWSLAEPPAADAPPVVYLRWAGGAPLVAGQHPANDTYPMNAWRPGEVVPDFYLLPLPDGCEAENGCPLAVEVAVAPRFTPAAGLAWQTVTIVPVAPRPGPVGQPRRALLEGSTLDGVDFPTTARPETALPLRYSGRGAAGALDFLVVPTHAVTSIIGGSDPPAWAALSGSMAFSAMVDGAVEAGPSVLIALPAGEPRAVCGWLQRPATGCVVAEIDISGAALPEGAVNFAGKIALLEVVVDAAQLQPGGQLPVTLTWQGLAPMSEDYTVFVQVLDAADRIIGQVDSWPVQGTFPTSQWTPGETVTDPYLVQLSADLPPGDYRVHAGLYLLATLQRLPVVDEMGAAVDDKVEIPLR